MFREPCAVNKSTAHCLSVREGFKALPWSPKPVKLTCRCLGYRLPSKISSLLLHSQAPSAANVGASFSLRRLQLLENRMAEENELISQLIDAQGIWLTMAPKQMCDWTDLKDCFSEASWWHPNFPFRTFQLSPRAHRFPSIFPDQEHHFRMRRYDEIPSRRLIKVTEYKVTSAIAASLRFNNHAETGLGVSKYISNFGILYFAITIGGLLVSLPLPLAFLV